MASKRTMMRQYELVERVRRYNPHANEELLDRAYVYAMKAHGTQKRASGDPYLSHPLEVAAILTDLRLDDATIVAAVLHDTIEDTDSTRDEIDKVFGPDIGRLVEGLTKLKRLDLVSKRAVQAENFRKLLLAIAADVRVLLVKLADRLHNMRTLHFMPAEKQARIAEETLDIYAPLAGRMGMQSMRDELDARGGSDLQKAARRAAGKERQDHRQRRKGTARRAVDARHRGDR
jgi:GTP diphosphokinase / guanosine-3',5'-bis(diphosphate) 3'-diphosphatase